MTGGFPIHGLAGNFHDVGLVPISSIGGTNTKGSYSQLISSTTRDAAGFILQTNYQPFNTSANLSFDIAVGAAASETIIVADLFLNNVLGASLQAYNQFYIPINIKAGTRISTRIQTNNTTVDARVAINLFDGGFIHPSGFAAIDTIGFTSASTTGVTITGPGSPGNGTFTQLTASTSHDYFGFFCCLSRSSTVGSDNTIDIAVGGAGSEVIIVPTYFVRNDSNCGSNSPIFPTFIPSGTRLSARLNTLDTGSISMGIVVYGLR